MTHLISHECPCHVTATFSDSSPLELNGPCGRADCKSAACRFEAGVTKANELDKSDFVREVELEKAA